MGRSRIEVPGFDEAAELRLSRRFGGRQVDSWRLLRELDRISLRIDGELVLVNASLPARCRPR